MPKPLALYIFNSKQAETNESKFLTVDRGDESKGTPSSHPLVFSNTISGGVTINDVILHAGVPGCPLGGIGESDHGYYHGKYSFDAYTHLRPVVGLPNWVDRFIGFRYPPYDVKDKKMAVVKNRLGF